MLRILVLAALASLCSADVPVDCRYSDAIGTWLIAESARTGDSSLNCTTGVGKVVYVKQFTMEYPNLVTDELGHMGTWTMISNQGFEVNINERSYWAPFYFDLAAAQFSCAALSTGWSRDDTVRHWACYSGTKTDNETPSTLRYFTSHSSSALDEMYTSNHELIERINTAQSSWTARSYPHHELYTRRELLQRGGGSYRHLPATAPASEELKALTARLPTNFDWRNINSVSYMSPVRDQGSCGSCYAFASTGLLEARVRIATDNARQDIFSTQDIISCTDLSEGCSGGFTILIGGRYAKDQGLVSEECNTYEATDEMCDTNTTCDRTYVSDYEFVGGYYGAGNEELMMEAVVKSGPIGVDFYVEEDFYSYSGGIYSHVSSLQSHFDPYYATTHAVLLVGYGVEPETGEKFWTVKNSWGAWWGEDGYFRIRRGTNEVGIESAAFDTTVIP